MYVGRQVFWKNVLPATFRGRRVMQQKKKWSMMYRREGYREL
jgi:hypothetical protein